MICSNINIRIKVLPMKKLADFVVNNLLVKNSKYCCIGTYQDKPSVLEISLEKGFKPELSTCVKTQHKLTLHNDIYYTADVLISFKPIFNLIHPVTFDDVEKYSNSYFYKKESYDEYLEEIRLMGQVRDDIYIQENACEENISRQLVRSNDFAVYITKIKSFGTRISDTSSKEALWNLSNNNPLICNSKNPQDSEIQGSIPNSEIVDSRPISNEKVVQIKLLFLNPKYRTIRDIDDVELILKAKDILLESFKNMGIIKEHVCIYTILSSKTTRFQIIADDISDELNITSPSGIVFIDTLIKNLQISKEYYKMEHYYIDNSI